MLFTFDNDTVPRVDGMILTFEGSTVSFSCPPGFVLTGPDSATCTGNGEWELDSRKIMCNNISDRSEGTLLNKSKREEKGIYSNCCKTVLQITRSSCAITIIMIIMHAY